MQIGCEMSRKARPADGSGRRKANSLQCCMCGDEGFVDQLGKCSVCGTRYQHLYCCVQQNPEGVVVLDTGWPDPFLCDWCRQVTPSVVVPAASAVEKAAGKEKLAPHAYKPRLMQEKNGGSAGADGLDFLVQAALDGSPAESCNRSRDSSGENASNEVRSAEGSACDTVSSTSTIESVSGHGAAARRKHRQGRAALGQGQVQERLQIAGDTLSSSSSEEQMKGSQALGSDVSGPAADGIGSKDACQGFTRLSISKEGVGAEAAAASRAASNTRAGASPDIWMPPVRLMRGFKKSNHVVANKTLVQEESKPPESPPPAPRALLRSQSLKALSDRRPPIKEGALERSSSLQSGSSITRRKQKLLESINSEAPPVVVQGAGSRSPEGDKSLPSPSVKRMRISNGGVEAKAPVPKGLLPVRRYKSLSELSC